MPESKRRLLAFVALVVACVVAGSVYVVWTVAGTESASGQGVRSTSARIERGAVVFRSLDRKDGSYGEVALASNPTAGGARTLTGLTCERVHANTKGGICLARAKAFGIKYDAIIFGPSFQTRRKLRLTGIPSRTRISPDGRYGAVTAFVTGHSYAADGRFSTQTLIVELATGKTLLDLEDLEVLRKGRRIDAIDENYWGVTFGAAGRFYATVMTGGDTFLIEGRVGSKKAQVLIVNAECPSLSPDRTRVAYKKRVGEPEIWRFHVLDLASGRETALAETKPIDDQVEWLDDERILYRVDEEIWSVRADGGGAPQVYLRRADSPAVVRS